jgi:hypothetical protein
MPKTYPQELHAIWNAVLHDPAVPASSIIMEAMSRAHAAGFKLGDEGPTVEQLGAAPGTSFNIFDAAAAPIRQFKPK